MSRRVMVTGAIAGFVLIVLGGILLTVEVEEFRWTTQRQNFTGLTCGTPLDHPAWKTGDPCHGAVNRQTVVAAAVLIGGLGMVIGATAGSSRVDEATDPPRMPADGSWPTLDRDGHVLRAIRRVRVPDFGAVSSQSPGR